MIHQDLTNSCCFGMNYSFRMSQFKKIVKLSKGYVFVSHRKDDRKYYCERYFDVEENKHFLRIKIPANKTLYLKWLPYGTFWSNQPHINKSWLTINAPIGLCAIDAHIFFKNALEHVYFE